MVSIRAGERWEPPEWALLERTLIDQMNRAAIEFANRYTRSDGTLVWREEWPGMDGSDDSYESFHNFPLLYALGGSEEVHQLSRKLWDALTWQWTEYGQIYREFDAYYDWMHHGESSLYFYYFGLANPSVLKDRQRAVRFADMYTGDDAEAPNYDKRLRMIRSPINGSRGPRFEMTAEDWCTHRPVLDNYPPPFEDIPDVSGPKCQWTDDRVFAEILSRMNACWARGDVPLNLTSTSLVTHAYAYTADERYRKWVLEYLSAWKERVERNGGIAPDNIGPSGEIGELLSGKWWGGYYGWRWPHGVMNILDSLTISGCNGVLLEGDLGHLDLVRSQLDKLWELRREDAGKWVVPHRHLDSGWADYRPQNPDYAIACWNVSMQDEDYERVTRLGVTGDWNLPNLKVGKGNLGNTRQWFQYIRGHNPRYPEQILRANHELAHRKLEAIRSDEGDPAEWDVHHWQDVNPVVCEGLVQLTLGAPMHVYHGGLLHAPLRYYDAYSRRAGLPESVGALVESRSQDSVTVSLVNLDLLEERRVIIQAGAFAEHEFESATVLDRNGDAIGQADIRDRWLEVRLLPGAGTRLKLRTRRYAHLPSYHTPWFKTGKQLELLRGRDIAPRGQ